MVSLASYSIPLTFKCQSTAVNLVGPLTVAKRVLWNRVWPILPSCCLCRCFLGIGSLDFSEFGHDVRNPYEVVHDSQIFLKNTLPPKVGKIDQKQGFFNLKKHSVIDFHLICSVMKIYIICCVPAQIVYLGKMFFLKYRPKWSKSNRLLDFQINYFSRINWWNSLIFTCS